MNATLTPDPAALRERVRAEYGAIAAAPARSCCGGTQTADGLRTAASTYAGVGEAYAAEAGYVPEADLGLGCGVPTALAGLAPGQTVLDLGSGAGNDAFIARRQVGADGRVIGIDFTPEMIARAEANRAKLGYDNVEFRLGGIEDLPVCDAVADVVISNCVLNLVPDKARAFAEIFRVLRPGGHFCVSDIVLDGQLPDGLRQAAELYVGCIAGALQRADYLAVAAAAGFDGVEVARERPVELPDEALREHLDEGALAAFRAGGARVLSVTVRGRRPGGNGSAPAASGCGCACGGD